MTVYVVVAADPEFSRDGYEELEFDFVEAFEDRAEAEQFAADLHELNVYRDSEVVVREVEVGRMRGHRMRTVYCAEATPGGKVNRWRDEMLVPTDYRSNGVLYKPFAKEQFGVGMSAVSPEHAEQLAVQAREGRIVTESGHVVVRDHGPGGGETE